MKTLYHEEIMGRYGVGHIIDATEVEPGTIEISLTDAKTGDKAAVATAITVDQAKRAFDEVVLQYAHPLQETIYSADLTSGKRYTLVMISDFGFPIALNLTFDSLRFTTYAQYVDVVELKFLPFRKRKLRRMFLYNRSFMIYDGWRSLEQNMVMNALDDHFRISKYACFDERYMDDIKQAWPDYIACYDRDCGDYPDEQSSAEQKLNAVDAIEEREIMHGLTLTADSESERGYCLDISPELFAALYSNGSDNLAKEERLERSLYRATIACISHILDEDGGTCNFDSPALDYKAYGISKESAKEVFKRCGLSSFDWGEKLVIGSYTSGQGNRRTKMAESFALQLAADGIPSDVYYQMD